MLIIPTLLLIIYILSTYLFDKFRIAMAFLTSMVGLTLMLNDWNNTVVDDATVKLTFILSFLLYSMMVMYMVYITEDKTEMKK